MKRIQPFIFAILLISILAACNETDSNEEAVETVIPVEVVEADEGDLVIERSIYGRTAPDSVTPVLIETPGEIDSLKVENGDMVKEDDVIATVKTQAGTQEILALKSGEIANLDIEEGVMASGEEPLAVIVNIENLSISVGVTSGVRSLFEKDNEEIAVINDQEYKINITSVSMLPEDTGLYTVEATVNNEENDLLPGMISIIQVPEKRITKSIILPTEAIVEEADGTFVYLIENDEAVKVDITIEEAQTDRSAIKGEINKGDQIVKNGQLTLSDGSKVEIVKEGNES